MLTVFIPCALSFAVVLVGFEVDPTYWVIKLPTTQFRNILSYGQGLQLEKERCLNFLNIFSSSPGMKIDISYPLQSQSGLRLQGQAPLQSILTSWSLFLVKQSNSHLLKYVVPSDPQISCPHTLK